MERRRFLKLFGLGVTGAVLAPDTIAATAQPPTAAATFKKIGVQVPISQELLEDHLPIEYQIQAILADAHHRVVQKRLTSSR